MEHKLKQSSNFSAFVAVIFGLLILPCKSLPADLQSRQALGAYPAPNHNNFACKSPFHPNPVVIIHGLLANTWINLNVLETNLELQGFCTFGITYGAYPEFPFVGGLKPIAESASDLAAFIKQVKAKTGAAKIDIVGHSEGAFQSLYIPKFEPGISAIVNQIVAIAPPTHGTTVSNLYDLAYIGGNITKALVNDILDSVGCDACSDLVPGGAAVKRLNDGNPIKQPNNKLLVIISRTDEIITPVQTAQVNEAGVRNVYIQDRCPNDKVGHVGEGYDKNVWGLVANALDSSIPIPKTCYTGLPF